MDTTQAAIVQNEAGTQINSWLHAPKIGTGEVTGSFDAWLFPVNDEFDVDFSSWSYSYHVLLKDEDLLSVREAPLWWDNERYSGFDEEELTDMSWGKSRAMLPSEMINSCGPSSLPLIK